ncbi:MAG: hypothetical protein JWN25_1083 [Verrucomicrobiales bacterium]|nr:hypothetical protein [Verrucomicrobiales bacterium]
MKKLLLGMAVFLMLGERCAMARINVVSLPSRDSVQLTIYNSVDLTMVKETRVLTFRKGMNRLEFSWANTLIDPTSVEFKALSHADQIDLVDISFPPRVSNALEWRIKSEFEGEVTVEIQYFTSGISWSADYVAEANRQEKLMSLAGSVKVVNHSGEDYENAQVRLVVGVIRLVEQIAALAQTGLPASKPAVMSAPAPAAQRAVLSRAMASSLAVAKEKEVVKEELSEYFLYTVEGRDTIPTGWSKKMPSFLAKNVPISSYYKFENEQWGERVMRFYRFKNDKASKLGNEPLPDGLLNAFRLVSDDSLYSFVGASNVKYIPLNEQVEVELGVDPEVIIKATLKNYEKSDLRFGQGGNVSGWTTKNNWELEVQNSKEIDVTLDIRRNLPGDWSLTTESKYEKVDANKVKFLVTLKPHESQKLNYEVVTRHGTSVNR